MASEQDDPLEQQQLLAESSLPLLFETYDAAVKDGMKLPLVLLVDCEDEIGGQIARDVARRRRGRRRGGQQHRQRHHRLRPRCQLEKKSPRSPRNV